MKVTERARKSLAALAAAGMVLLLATSSSCRRPSTVDTGGAATGDDLGRITSEGEGAGSAVSNDSILQQMPNRPVPPVHDETGRDTSRQ